MEEKDNVPLALLARDVHHLVQNTSALKAEMNARFDAVDRRFEAVDRRFEAVDKRFEAVDKRFEAVDKRFAGIDARLDGLAATLHTHFLWLLGAIGATITAVAAGFIFLVGRQDSMTQRLETSIDQLATELHAQRAQTEKGPARPDATS